MVKPRKEILFHYNGYTLHLNVTERHSLRGLRRLIGKKISSYMKPQGDWIFLVNGVQVGKTQEENEMLWRDIIRGDEQKCKVELIEKISSSLKRKPTPKEEEDEDSGFIPEEVKEEPDLDFEEEIGQSTRSRRKKMKRAISATVTPDRVPSNDRSATPEHTHSGAVALPETPATFTPDRVPSNGRSVTPDHTNSAAIASPETRPNSQNVLQETASNDQPDANAMPSSALKSVVIKEETRKMFAAQRKKDFAKYGDRFLLHSQHPKGMMRLGGNTRTTFVVPREDHPVLETSDYPKPLHLAGKRKGDIQREDFGYMAFNTAWQPNGPMYAGQKSAAVSSVPVHFKKTRDPFPIFMKRTLTTKEDEKEGRLLGWEYVGNYKYDPLLGDETAKYWESAKNVSQASKNEIARKIFESSQKEGGWKVKVIDEWRVRLIEATSQDGPHAEHSLAARSLDLGFEPNMSGDRLCKLIVQLDEYHLQDSIKFVKYDERIYNYCFGGKTNCTKDGATIRSGAVGGPAKAQDWYDFATVNMLFPY